MAQKYGDDVKGAVMAALLTGQSVSSVARDYNLPKGTVSSWKERSREVATDATVGDPKSAGVSSPAGVDLVERQEIGNLLLQYLVASLRTLKTQVEVFGDRDWLKKQPASEVAVLHGVVTDKAIRLLEGLAERSADAPA